MKLKFVDANYVDLAAKGIYQTCARQFLGRITNDGTFLIMNRAGFIDKFQDKEKAIELQAAVAHHEITHIKCGHMVKFKYRSCQESLAIENEVWKITRNEKGKRYCLKILQWVGLKDKRSIE
jgi:hypothetical protein